MNMREVRFTTGAGLSAQPNDGTMKGGSVLRGYAAVFDSPSHDLGNFVEVIKPGAFRSSLRTTEVLGLFAHDYSNLLARTGTGSLELHEDARGLAFTMRLPNTSLGRDIRELVSAGELSEMSFGFVTLDEAWSRDHGRNLRILKKVNLHEISIVPQAAYSATSISLRAAVAALDAAIVAALADRRRRLEALLTR